MEQWILRKHCPPPPKVDSTGVCVRATNIKTVVTGSDAQKDLTAYCKDATDSNGQVFCVQITKDGLTVRSLHSD